jgi:hypothetical protein
METIFNRLQEYTQLKKYIFKYFWETQNFIIFQTGWNTND